MNTTNLNRGELRKRESLINSPNAVQLRTPQPISRVENPNARRVETRFSKATIHFAPRNGRIPLFARASERGRPASEWFAVKNVATSEAAEITINGEIGEDWFGEGTNAKDFKAALDLIPRDRKILVLLDSPGGNVWDGLAIANLLKERRANVTVKIYGVALSIASVIAIAGSKVILCKTSQYMAHDPWSGLYVVGTEEDIAEEAERARNALKAAKRSIIIAYKDRTGKSEEDIAALMKAETWYVGQEAKDAGFVDEISDDEAVLNSFDLSNFKRVPEAFRKLQNSAGQNGGHSSIMNRQQIIARLKKMGITVDEKSTDEQLVAQLDAAIEARTQTTTTPPPAVPGASAPDAATTNRIAQLEANYAAERRTRITNAVNACVAERRIIASQAASWIERAVKDEAVLNDLQALPQNIPSDPINVECVSESIHDIAAHAKRLGGHVRNSERNPTALSTFITKNRAKFIEVWNANTIDATLKQDVLHDEGLRAFAKLMNNLSAFSTKYENQDLRGTGIVTVPFYNLQTAASTDWNATNGYVAGNTAVSKAQVTINKRKYQALSFTSDELRRQPFLGLQQNMVLNAEKLAYDVQQDIFSAITAANFATTAYTGIASTFDSAIVANLQLSATTTGQWPFVGRSLWLSSAYDTNLKKDTALKLFFNSGTTSVLQDGRWNSKLYGFDYYEAPNLPTNGAENLTGFIAFQSAMLIATAPIAPSEEVIRDGTQYSVMADPNGGPVLEMRKMGDSQKDNAIWVVECNYGYNVGNGAALQRIKSA